jgi:hypothetical protein
LQCGKLRALDSDQIQSCDGCENGFIFMKADLHRSQPVVFVGGVLQAQPYHPKKF